MSESIVVNCNCMEYMHGVPDKAFDLAVKEGDSGARPRRLTAKGYVRYRTDSNKRLRMEHDLVWEEHYGEIPQGMQIHHKDFDKTNNNIENLQLVTPLEHKRLHSGCILKEGIWYKKCKVCGEYKPCTEEYWYLSRGWISGRTCKRCYVKKVVADRRSRVANGWRRTDYVPKKSADSRHGTAESFHNGGKVNNEQS